MAVIVPILSTFNDKGIKAAVKEFQTATNKIQKFGAVGKVFDGVGQSLTKNVTAPIIAVGGALALMVKGAIEAEASQHRLRQILLTTGGASNAQVDALLKQAEALEQLGVVSKENVTVAQSQLATFDLQATTIEALTPAILDYVTAEKGATASSEDFKSMTNGLAQAMQGNFASLTRTGFVLDDNTKKMISSGNESERAAAIVDVLNSTYKGFNESLADTPEGQMVKLQQEFGSVRDELGKSLIPLFNDFVRIIRSDIVPIAQRAAEVVKGWAASFNALDQDTRKNIISFIGLVAAIGPILIVVGKLIVGVSKLGLAFKALGITMGLTPFGILVLAIVGIGFAINEVVKKFGGWREVMRIVGNAIIGLAEGALNFIILQLNSFAGGINLVIRGLNAIGFNFKEVAGVGEVEFARISKAAYKSQQNIAGMSDFAKELAGVATKQVTPSLSAMSSGLDDAGDKASKTKDRIKQLRDALVDMRQEAVNKLKDSLKNAESQLDSARNKFNDFKNSIAGNVTGLLDFAKASEGDNFVQGLVGQAEDATEFANKVKQLIQLGLSERGIKEVLNAGFEAGTKIADELIAGGSTIVDQVNTLLASVSSVAEQVGDFGAREFYQAGVTQGESLVNGILDALRQAQAELAAAVKAAAQGGDIRTFGARASTLLDAIGGIKGSKKQANAIAAFEQALAGSGKISKKEDAAIRSRFKLAKGGIVMGPTNALIGEAGPEAVVPLSGANSARGALGSTINITVNAGIGTNGNQVGQQIVEAIKRYERTSGPVFASA